MTTRLTKGQKRMYAQKQPAAAKNQTLLDQDEHILVVKRSVLFTNKIWQGLNVNDFDECLAIIHAEQEFHPRSIMETDARFKQIIPYLVFTHDSKYFLMQRKAESSEQRLKNKFSLGIGGHIRKEDLSSTNIIDWARREFKEEVDYKGEFNVKNIGILNDDTNPVGEVHLGCVLLLEGDSDAISIKSELKNGELLSLEDCQFHYSQMESWSQTVFDHLKTLPLI